MLAPVPLGRDRPRHALAPHLGETGGVAVHPACHDVTADPRACGRAFGHDGGRVVRAARAEIGRPGRAGRVQDRRLFGGQRTGLFRQVLAREKGVEPRGDDRGQLAGGQFTRPRHQIVLGGGVMFADHLLGLLAGPVVEVFLELAFDDPALFLDDENLFLALHEGQRIAARQRPDHADLVDVDAERAALRLVQTQKAQRLKRVEVTFARRHDPIWRVGQAVDRAVDGVGFHEGLDRPQLRPHAHLDFRRGRIAPANVDAARIILALRVDEGAVVVQLDRAPGFHGFRDRLEPDPCRGIAAECEAVFAERQIFFDRSRVQHRHEPREEHGIRLVRHGG